MTEYTPTTEEVKDTHRRGVSGDRYPTRNGEWRNPDAEFDRWLAEHDRQVAAEALEQAAAELEPKERDIVRSRWLRERAQAVRENHDA